MKFPPTITRSKSGDYDGTNRRKIYMPFEKIRFQQHHVNNTQTLNTTTEKFVDIDLGREPMNEVHLFKREMSSESREEEEGFREYESLSYFNLPRPETPTDIVIAVQAITISSRRVQEAMQMDNVTLDLTTGHAIVGIVREKGIEVDDFEVGDRVTTIIETLGPNPRYAKFSSNLAVKVPFGVDSAEVASCSYTFLCAYQSIYHGVPVKFRYAVKPLSGYKVLVVDGIGMIGQATIQLALNAGAEEVYAISEVTHHEHLELIGAIPLLPEDWVQSVENQMDIVIDSVEASHYKQSAARQAMKENGKLVCVSTPISTSGMKSQKMKPFIKGLVAQIDLLFIQQKGTFYDLFSTIKNYPDIMKVSLEIFRQIK
jgi:NADPH:quinone reductase-like Zn-dependent oxidoreductase